MQYIKQYVDINKRTVFLLIVLIGLTIYIAWSAAQPNEFLRGSAPQDYGWAYLVWMIVLGLTIFGVSILRKPLARFIGAMFSFLLSAYLAVALGFSVMHSPPVQGNLAAVALFLALGLLFYSGYTCSTLLSKSQGT